MKQILKRIFIVILTVVISFSSIRYVPVCCDVPVYGDVLVSPGTVMDLTHLARLLATCMYRAGFEIDPSFLSGSPSLTLANMYLYYCEFRANGVCETPFNMFDGKSSSYYKNNLENVEKYVATQRVLSSLPAFLGALDDGTIADLCGFVPDVSELTEQLKSEGLVVQSYSANKENHDFFNAMTIGDKVMTEHDHFPFFDTHTYLKDTMQQLADNSNIVLSDYWFVVSHGKWTSFYNLPNDDDCYFKYDSKEDVVYANRQTMSSKLFCYVIQTKTPSYPYGLNLYTFKKEGVNTNILTSAQAGSFGKGLTIYTNANVNIYDDLSFTIFSPRMMSFKTFSYVEDSLADIVKKKGYAWEDIELADKDGSKLSSSTSNLVEEVDDYLLSKEDVEAFLNGQTAIKNSTESLKAVNTKTNETLGEIDEELDTQTGIFSNILKVLKNIFSKLKSVLTVSITNYLEFVNPITSFISGGFKIVSFLLEEYFPDFRAALSLNEIHLGDIQSILPDMLGAIREIPGKFVKFFDGVVSTVQSGFESVLDHVETLSTVVSSWLQDLADSFWALPSTIETALINAFVPSSESFALLKEKANNFCLEHFGVSGKEFSSNNTNGKELPDVYWEFKKNRLKIFDGQIVMNYTDKAKVLIDGALWLLLIIYIYNQILSIFDKKGVTNDSN